MCWQIRCLMKTHFLVALCSHGKKVEVWSLLDFPGSSDGKASAYNVGVLGLTPGSGRSPGEEHGNPLQYSCLENPMDRGAWWATVPQDHKELDTSE